MTHLSVATQRGVCWEGLQVILKKSPNLKDLTINGTLHYDRWDLEYVCQCVVGYSFLLTCRIEVLKITRFQGAIREMVQIEHVLEKLPCLKLLELHVQARGEYKKRKIIEDLGMLPRASSKCKVEVKFS
ncbi:putative F-box/LRR-repeat protein [Cardamine amara subsp. amara]|uniref:F-box/LRR-repeat protein n=1 Tax=Cardamine amara subsp. amara TaxID=228776 RepID=A0ABD1C9R4_CARAN